ncbi:hypothetical protein J2X45_003909 [Caulobacter sp. BE264]|uniref:hypothetical protein n=1 Tax=Caulobacter sp. BE264 TaxID=2817724 RepID=UPI002857D074|nr:hypothetical protein [Caulobacter sp. BE264]MDR7232799.1 hypothetical protein [Caulobacter sp. BE264]
MSGARNTIQTGMAHQHLPPGAGFAAARVCNEGRARADHWRDRSSVGMGWSLSGGGWVRFFQAQPLQSRVQRLLGEIAAPVSEAIQAIRSAKFGGLLSVLRSLDPRRDCNREGVCHVHRFVTGGHARVFNLTSDQPETFS